MSNLIIPFRANLLESGSPPIDTAFRMTVDTTKVGVTNTQSFQLSFAYLSPVDFTVDWGDGSTDVITSYDQVELTHGYASSGTYQVSLNGSFSGIEFYNRDPKKIMSIDNWGTHVFTTMKYAFFQCENMVANYTDIPNTSGVQAFDQMFDNCRMFNGAVEFDTSSAIDMYAMFKNCFVFNQPVNFDTSNVTRMQVMFNNNWVFNQSVTFDTSKVTSMNSMFLNAKKFNQPINFNAPLLTDTTSMFYAALEFNSPFTLTTTNVLFNLSSTFRKAPVFNSPVTISDTSGVGTFGRMFDEAFAFDQDISAFDPSSLETIAAGGGGAWFMLASIPWSTVNYDLLLIAWDTYGISDRRLTAGTAKYSAGAPATARANMVSRGWEFFDGGQA